MKWQPPTNSKTLGGWFQIVVTKPGYGPFDVTYFRGVPTSLDSFSSADPFGDSTAVLSFPQLSAFDDPDSFDLYNWYGLFSNVDIWWVPALTPAELGTKLPIGGPLEKYIDPFTGQPDIYAPASFYWLSDTLPAVRLYDQRIKVWEGFITSFDLSADETGTNIQAQCQGALFQLDRYMQKPYYPPQPLPFEAQIIDVFNKTNKPHLRTGPCSIQFPVGWQHQIPPHGTASPTTIDATPGLNWTGYADRNTGGWDRCLTGFIQNKLTLMVTTALDGVTPGIQWTLQQIRQSAISPGRTPVLLLRDNNRTPDFSVWLGTPGITVSLTRDGTQMANIVYGSGTSLDGTTWSNMVISNDGTRTDYQPLAAESNVWPYTNNKQFSAQPFVAEAYIQYGAGFDRQAAIVSADRTLARDIDPGYSGTMTMKVDPAEFPRWLIRSGMTVKIYGIAGTGESGINFHIPEVDASISGGTVSLKLDTRYRDLLTVEESLARTRDPLTPTVMLQTNKASQLIPDIMAPWNYAAGSGFVPKGSLDFFNIKPNTSQFPYDDWLYSHPPYKYPTWYAKVIANAPTRDGRWTLVPILTSEKGTIRLTQFWCCDVYGNRLKIPFHVSFYYVNVTPSAMPRDSGGPSPYINNAFTTINPATGSPWPPGVFVAPDPTYIIGWGSQVNGVMNRAGFSPGSEAAGNTATGLLMDESQWQFDNSSTDTSRGWQPNYPLGTPQTAASITIYAMIYAEYSEPVYFMGRLYRQDPGTT